MMAFRFLLPFLAAATILAACTASEPQPGQQTTTRACTPPRPWWIKYGRFPDMSIIEWLSLDRNGTVYLRHRVASLQEVSVYLHQVAQWRPEPIVFLQSEMGAPCATMETLRELVERNMDCRHNLACAEGVPSAEEPATAQAGDLPEWNISIERAHGE